MDPERFRSAMRRWPTGVAVVTASWDGRDAGLTVNALFSLSLEPPSLLFSLGQGTDTEPILRAARAFGVSLLAADQADLSERFAERLPPGEKFRSVPIRRGRTGAPLLEGAVATLEAEVEAFLPQRDHLLVVGRVVGAEAGPDRPPLVFFRRAYTEPRPPPPLPRHRARPGGEGATSP